MQTRLTRLLTFCAVFVMVLLAACGGGGGDDSSDNGSVIGGGDNGNGNGLPSVPPFEREDGQFEVPQRSTNQVEVDFVDAQHRNSNFGDRELAIDPVEEELLNAQSTVDIAVLRINRQDFVNELITLSNRGVRVRIVTEQGYYNDPAYQPFYQQLENAGVNVHTDNDGFPRLMHSRFIVIDNAVVLTGNFDFSAQGVDRHTGDVITLRNSQLAQVFSNEFNQMFEEGNFGASKRLAGGQSFVTSTNAQGDPTSRVEVYFGPTTDLRSKIGDHIRPQGQVGLAEPAAIWMAMKEWRDTEILNTIRSWYSTSNPQAPKDFYAIVNDRNQITDPNEDDPVELIVQDIQGGGDDNEGPTPNLRNASINISDGQQFNYRDNTLNHKYLYLDVEGPSGRLNQGAVTHVGDRVIITTANFTSNGLALNDEVMIVLRGDPLAAEYAGRINPRLNTVPSVADTNRLPAPDRFGEVWANHFAYPRGVTTSEGDQEDGIASPVAQAVVYGIAEDFSPTTEIQTDTGDGGGGGGGGDGGLGPPQNGGGGGGGDDGTIGGDNSTSVPITLNFTINGQAWANGQSLTSIFDGEVPTMGFNRNEESNPRFSYLQVVPAGNITMTVQASPTEQAGTEVGEFETSDFDFTLGPGAVRNIDINVSTSPQGGGPGIPGGGGTGGGGTGGGGFPGGGGGFGGGF